MKIEIDSFVIIIENRIFLEVQKYLQRGNEDESGGILVGKKENDNDIYHIVGLSFPNECDKSTHCSFVRNAQEAQKIIEKTWQESGGYVNYIGEWHTHPELFPSPSRTDKKTYRQISKDKSSLFLVSINIIFGNKFDCYICGYKNGKMIFERTLNYEEILYPQS